MFFDARLATSTASSFSAVSPTQAVDELVNAANQHHYSPRVPHISSSNVWSRPNAINNVVSIKCSYHLSSSKDSRGRRPYITRSLPTSLIKRHCLLYTQPGYKSIDPATMANQTPSNLPTHFALVVYPQFEVLDAFGPTEVVHAIGHPMVNPKNAANVKLSIIGPSLEPVSTGPAEGDPLPVKSKVAQTIVPTHTFDDPPKDVDVLIVPGGFGAGPKSLWGGAWEPEGVERVVRYLREMYPGVRYLLSK
jgi:hypothetical protein